MHSGVSCGSFAAQAGEVAVRGSAYGGSSVVDHHASPPAAVDPVEFEGFHAAGDVLDGGRVQGDEVGIAPHEADPAAVLDHGDGVSGQQGATALGAGWPVQHGGAVEVTADAGHGDTGDGLDAFVEVLDAW